MLEVMALGATGALMLMVALAIYLALRMTE